MPSTEATPTDNTIHFALTGTTACGRAVYSHTRRTKHLLWDEVTDPRVTARARAALAA